MKNKTLLYGLIAVGGYLLWKKYFKKTEVIVDEGFDSDEIGGSKLEIAMLECKSKALIHFADSKVSEEVKKEWIENCVRAKMLEK
jgi:hypothetical protein